MGIAEHEIYPEEPETGVIERIPAELALDGLANSLKLVPRHELTATESVFLSPEEDLFDPIAEPTSDELSAEEIHQLETDAQTDTLRAEALDQLLDSASRYKLLTAAQEVHLAKRIEHGDPAAKELMMNSNIRLVASIAKQYWTDELEMEDLVAEGMFGLNRAVEKFDWRRGFKFSTYATWWIRQACQRANYDKGRTIRVPVHIQERIQKIAKAKNELVQTLERPPTHQEIAQQTNLNINHVIEADQAMIASVSLNAVISNHDHDDELMILFKDETELGRPVDELVEQNAIEQDLVKALEWLTDTERNVLTLRYGLDEGQPLTQIQTGKQMGISRDEVSVIEKKAIHKLQTNFGQDHSFQDNDNFEPEAEPLNNQKCLELIQASANPEILDVNGQPVPATMTYIAYQRFLGSNNHEIAKAMGYTYSTVKGQISQLKQILDITDDRDMEKFNTYIKKHFGQDEA